MEFIYPKKLLTRQVRCMVLCWGSGCGAGIRIKCSGAQSLMLDVDAGKRPTRFIKTNYRNLHKFNWMPTKMKLWDDGKARESFQWRLLGSLLAFPDKSLLMFECLDNLLLSFLFVELLWADKTRNHFSKVFTDFQTLNWIIFILNHRPYIKI